MAFWLQGKVRHGRRDALFLTRKARHGPRDALFLTRKVHHGPREAKLAPKFKHGIRQLMVSLATFLLLDTSLFIHVVHLHVLRVCGAACRAREWMCSE